MPSNVVEINSVSEWNQALRGATSEGRTVVVDFWATWCGPCKVIAPAFDQLAKLFPQVTFLRVDVDAQRAISGKYRITAMPTFIAFKSGKPVETIKGADPRLLNNLVKKHAGPNPPIPPLPEAAEEAKLAGNDHFKKGEYNEAVKKYSTAISIAPLSAPLFANRSISYLKSTPPDIVAAIEDARQATVLDPKWGKGWVRLGEALEANGASAVEIKAAYEKALELIEEGRMREETQEKLNSLHTRVSASS